MLFKNIVGHKTLVKHLIQSIRGKHVAHAQLFAGKPGGAQLALALAFATYLNCQERNEEDACGVCPSCNKMRKYMHPDVYFTFPTVLQKDKRNSKHYLKEWRTFLDNHPFGDLNDWLHVMEGTQKAPIINAEDAREIMKNLSLKAFEADYKIQVIWLPEWMNQSAANAILKILEEPASQTVFLLVTNNQEALLSTIQSRVQTIMVPELSDEELNNYLMEHLNVDQEKSYQFVKIAEGNLNKAQKLAQSETPDLEDEFKMWMRDCYSASYGALVKRADDFHVKSRQEQINILQFGLNTFRDAFLLKLNTDHSINKNNFLTGFSKVVHENNLEELYTHLNEAHHLIERNVSAKMVYLDVSIQISKIFKHELS